MCMVKRWLTPLYNRPGSHLQFLSSDLASTWSKMIDHGGDCYMKDLLPTGLTTCWCLSTVTCVIHRMSKKEILKITHAWYWLFYSILIDPAEFKIFIPKGNPFSWHFLGGLHVQSPCNPLLVEFQGQPTYNPL